MRLRWLLFDFTDPALPMTLRQRIRVALRCQPIWRVPRKHRRGLYLYTGAMLLAAALGIIGQFLFIWDARPGLFVLLAFMAYWIGAFWIGNALLWGYLCRGILFERIRKEGFNVCTACGHLMQGLHGRIVNCPTCGSEQENLLEGFSLCDSCGYLLRGLHGQVINCPECGKEQENHPPHEQRISQAVHHV